jgi:hypothetical protein
MVKTRRRRRSKKKRMKVMETSRLISKRSLKLSLSRFLKIKVS